MVRDFTLKDAVFAAESGGHLDVELRSMVEIEGTSGGIALDKLGQSLLLPRRQFIVDERGQQFVQFHLNVLLVTHGFCSFMRNRTHSIRLVRARKRVCLMAAAARPSCSATTLMEAPSK